MICKKCEKDHVRVISPVRRDTGRAIFVDDLGRQWNGYMCPDCKNPPKIKLKPKLSKKKVRKCGCGRKMEASRYYRCLECQPELEPDEGDWVYGTY